MIQEKINQENNGDACQDTNTNTVPLTVQISTLIQLHYL